MPEDTILDGELIFNRRIKGVKPWYHVFDIIKYKGLMVVHLPLTERRILLESFIFEGPVSLVDQIYTDKKSYYQLCLRDPENEGIVMKKLSSTAIISDQSCKQNPHWIKVKRPEDHTVR
jgi:ATP-dependent DNA ligase